MKKFCNYFIVILLTVLSSCSGDLLNDRIEQTSFADLESFREKGSFTAITDFNSVNYFIYKGTPMGFHYELLKSFSAYCGLNIEIIPENDISRSLRMINSGEADLLAMDLAQTESLNSGFRFSEAVGKTRQVLVQRKPNRWKSMPQTAIDKELVKDPSQLKGMTVYVRSGSAAAECMRGLNTENEGRITVIEVPYETENLISLVAKREIDFVVCDEKIARVNAEYFSVVDSRTVLSDYMETGWIFRKYNSGTLAEEFGKWFSAYSKTRDYAFVYAKYYRNTSSARIVKSDYYTLSTGKVSPWDRYIKSFSDSINWDWRLLASLIYQESGFRSDITSPAGAYGLMQVLPATGRYFGIDVKSNPLENMKAGISYIRYLQEFFNSRISDENERIKFVLAAYNAGEGNITDAMKLAEKYGRDPNLWDENVAYFLERKSDPLYYKDPVVTYGYCRGAEPVNYVAEILDRYSHYRNIIPDGTNRLF